MTTSTCNPFDFSLEWLAQNLAGRDDEVGTIRDLISRGGLGLVTGERGIGKSSTVLRAATRDAGARSGWCVRFDFSLSRDPDTFAATVRSQLKNQKAEADSAGKLKGVLGDLTKAAAGSAAAPLGDEAAANCLSALTSAIRELCQRNGRSAEPVVIVLDSAERIAGTTALGSIVGNLAKEEGVHACVFGAVSDAATQLCARIPQVGGDASRHLKLPALPPSVLANWIDQQFLQHGVVPNGAGTACVERAPSGPAKAIELARSTFDLCFSARYVGKTSVETAYKLNALLRRESGPSGAERCFRMGFDFSLNQSRSAGLKT